MCQSISSFFSTSSQIIDSIHCDFDNNGINDIICITNDTIKLNRTLFFFKALDKNNFEIVERNDTLMMKYNKDGWYGNPFCGMSYSNDTLWIGFTGWYYLEME